MVAIANDVKNNNAQTPVDNQNNDTQQQQNLQDNFNKTIEELKGKENNPKPNNDNQNDGKITKNLVVQTSSLNQTSDNITPTSITNFDGTPATQRSDGSVIRINEDGTQTLINGDISDTYPKGYEIPPVVVEKQTRGVEDGEKPSLTAEQAIDKIAGTGWSKDVVTYSLDSEAMSEFEMQQTRKAFEEWNKVTGIEIREATDGETADITVTNTELPDNVNGRAKRKYDYDIYSGLSISSVEIELNNIHIKDDNATDGSFNYKTILHEIGHSLGLNHPGRYNGAGKNYEDNAEYKEDTKRYSTMSYFDANADDSGTDHKGKYSVTPQVYDIAAIQSLYGKNETTNNGDDIYKFEMKITPEETIEVVDWDQYYIDTGIDPDSLSPMEALEIMMKHASGDESIPSKEEIIPEKYENPDDSIRTIYDTGGTDTLDISTFSPYHMKDDARIPVKQTISLEDGTYSSIGFMTNNVAIVGDIENVISGGSEDNITGNDLNNRISSGGGNDIVDVKLGRDTIIDSYGDDEYTVGGLTPLQEAAQNLASILTGKTVNTVDDRVFFKYSETESYGNDTVRNFDPNMDKIVIEDAPDGYEPLVEQNGNDTLITYGNATIRLVDVDASTAINFIELQ